VSDKNLDAICDGALEASLAQYNKKLKCWKCEETGHAKRNRMKKSKKKQSTENNEEEDGIATESEGGRRATVNITGTVDRAHILELGQAEIAGGQ
jgi:DNA-directed RNA polymerase subunit M/transcription elongation factor TFIIS